MSTRSVTIRRSTLARTIPILVLIAFALTVPAWGSGYVWSFGSMLLLWVGLTVSWNLISGYTGYVSLGQTAFFGVGAYVGISMFRDLHVPWMLAVIIAGVVTAFLAAPIGFVLLRLRGPFFAVGMLGLSEVFRVLALLLSKWTGGGAGAYYASTTDIWSVYYVFLGLAVIAIAVTFYIDMIPYGRSLLAIRDDEEAAEVVGVRTTSSKVKAFIVSAFFPGAIGATYAVFLGYMDPTTAFPIEYNLIIVLMGALGGVGTVIGPVIGALVAGSIREILWVNFPRWNLVFFGAAMVLTVLLLPGGIVARARSVWDRIRGIKDREGLQGKAPTPELDLSTLSELLPERDSTAPRQGPVLTVEGLNKSFNRRQVINDCGFSVETGSITGLIGPNGSGKTTTLNMINGVLSNDGGRITLGGTRIDRLSPHRIAHLGLGRTFQLPRLFDRLSVLDNLLVASDSGLQAGAANHRAQLLLKLVGLDGLQRRPAKKLSYGQRKLLEIARSLMVERQLILMDEPFAGVNPVLRGTISELIQALRDRGITFLIIGHEIAEMTALCDTMIVMDQGAVLTVGEPETVLADERVFDAYFGRPQQRGRSEMESTHE